MASSASPPRINLRFLLSLKTRELIEFCQSAHLIPGNGLYPCPKCQNAMKLIQDSSSLDGFRWACTAISQTADNKRVRCRYMCSLRKGTMFKNSHLEIWQILAFIKLWVDNVALTVIAEEVEVSYTTAVDWGAFCREVVFDAMIRRSDKLGGEGKVVQIDECQLGPRKKDEDKRTDCGGPNDQWVFGGFEVGSGRIFMVPVESRSAETLLPIIHQWILPGTTIVSDFWQAYDCLQDQGFLHLKVDRGISFVDPATGAHTNNIRSSWRHAKDTLPTNRRKKEFLAGYLAKYMFLKSVKQKNAVAFMEFCAAAGHLYNPMMTNVIPEEIKSINQSIQEAPLTMLNAVELPGDIERHLPEDDVMDRHLPGEFVLT